MQILHVCSELFPLLKTGGLADVTGALPAAQIAIGMDARVLIPSYPAIRKGIGETKRIGKLSTFAGPVQLYIGHVNGVGVYLIDAPALYDRPGSPYHDASQRAYGDNYLRFALPGWIAAELACGLDPTWRPDVVHAHDWHAGLACAYLALRGRPAKSVFTIHNLAYQGLFPAHCLEQIQLPRAFFTMDGLEFHGQISYLKAGLSYADHITTVSPTYANEITHPELGCGMEGLLTQKKREGRLSGILNGVDEAIWDPIHDPLLIARYDRDSLDSRAENKRYLQTTVGLNVEPETPLFAVVSRLTGQKGLDLVLDVLPDLLAQGGQLVLLGSGDAQLQQGFLDAAAQNPGRVSVQIGHHEALSHRIIGGADVMLIPSRFEPCGLTQLYGLKYGALPLVRRTGGLADTVNDCSPENLARGSASGFVFEQSNAASLLKAIKRTFILWSCPVQWRRVQRQSMAMNFSWQVAARTYNALYQRLF